MPEQAELRRIGGRVLESLPNALYRVELLIAGRPAITAHLSPETGLLRVLPGQSVEVELSPHDGTRGRIVSRNAARSAPHGSSFSASRRGEPVATRRRRRSAARAGRHSGMRRASLRVGASFSASRRGEPVATRQRKRSAARAERPGSTASACVALREARRTSHVNPKAICGIIASLRTVAEPRKGRSGS